ncbi:uncharacterized protein [Rhodnius prolixus]|uniref:uncharacterized protein n=1 Tax=Rhodnius prolixus TaxID=13249 RepID=UPI003D18A9E9
MDSVSYFVVVFYFSANIWAQQLQPSVQQLQNLQQIITVKPSVVSKKSISDFSLFTNTLQQIPSTETLINLPEFSENGKKEVHDNVKAIIVTKRVPVPYTVHVEKKIPYPIRVPVRRPYTVYVPKPYLVELPKPYPFAIKVPMPQPYTVEKHIPFPVKIPIDKPYPVHINKPYPIFIEKKVPYPIEKHIPVQIKIPVERPYPVHIPFEKPVPYPVEKPIHIPVSFPVDRPVPIPIEKPIPIPIEKLTAVEKPQISELLADSKQVSSNDHNVTTKTPVSNFQPSTYDPVSSSIMTQENNKPISFLPGTIQQSYTLGTIHVPENVEPQKWNFTANDWIPKQQYIYANTEKSLDFMPKTVDSYKYVLPEQLTSAFNVGTIETYSNAPILKETHGIHYEPVKYEAFKQEIIKSAQQNQQPKVQKPQQQQESINNYQTTSKLIQDGNKPATLNNYQFFNVHPQTNLQKIKPPENSQTSSISFQKFESIQHPEIDTSKWIPHSVVYNKPQMQYLTQPQQQLQLQSQQTAVNQQVQYEEIPQYTYQISHLIQPDNIGQKYQMQYKTQEMMNFIPTTQALYLAQPTYQEAPVQTNNRQNDQQPQQQTTDYQTKNTIQSTSELKTQYKRQEMPHSERYSEPVIYESINNQQQLYKNMNILAIPQTNSHAGIFEPTTAVTTMSHQTTLPATAQQIEPTSSTLLAGIKINSTEIHEKSDVENYHANTPNQSQINTIENTPINYSDINRTFVRKSRRKNPGKRKHNPETVQHAVKKS